MARKKAVWIDSQGGWNLETWHRVSTEKWSEDDFEVFTMMTPEVRLAYSSWIRGGSWLEYTSDTYASPKRFVNEIVLAK
jgi:hypothetical protein